MCDDPVIEIHSNQSSNDLYRDRGDRVDIEPFSGKIAARLEQPY